MNKEILYNKRLNIFDHSNHMDDRRFCVNHDNRSALWITGLNEQERKDFGDYAHTTIIDESVVGECCGLYGCLKCENCPLDIVGRGEHGFFPMNMESRLNFDKKYAIATANLKRLREMADNPLKQELLRHEVLTNQRNYGKRTNVITVKD